MNKRPVNNPYKNVNPLLNIDNHHVRTDYINSTISLSRFYQNNKNSCTYHLFNVVNKFKEDKFLQEDTGCDIHFINCGNGDACLIKNRGKNMLIDFGKTPNSVKTFLDENIEGKEIEYAVCTHFHQDHMTDFEIINKNYKINTLFAVKNCPKELGFKTQSLLKTFEESCSASTLVLFEIGNCHNDHSHNFKLGEAEFEFLGPIKDFGNLNDNSIVLKMNYKDMTILFTGDISKTAEKELIKWCKYKEIDLKSKVLKVAHHGSKGSSCLQFLNEVEPEEAIICCDKVNEYSHPHIEAIERINNYVKEMQCSYTDKSISYHISPEGVLEKKTGTNILPQYFEQFNSCNDYQYLN